MKRQRVVKRRIAVALALLVAVLVPLPVLASDMPPRAADCAGTGCRAQQVSAQLWTAPLAGTWAAGTGPGTTGDGGTVPAGGRAAYVAVGGGLVAVGTGLSLAGYTVAAGRELWQTALSGPAGTEIMSVRAWPGVITVGLLAPGGQARTEEVIDATTGRELRHYPAGVFGGAVTASTAATVVIGPGTVTSYANATGRIRWRHTTSGTQAWQADGQRLYVAEAPGGYPSPSPVRSLAVINLQTGTQILLGAPLGQPFSGTLTAAVGGAVLFASPTRLTAYNGTTGDALWAQPGWVAEGTDPATRRLAVTAANGTLLSVNPLTAAVHAAVPASAATGTAAWYAVRAGVALGLDGGQNGTAWGYDMASGTVTWTSAVLPWPHFYSDVSGIGGSADPAGRTVVLTMCPHLAADQGICADPELVALHL